MHSVFPRGFPYKKNENIEDKLSHDIAVIALDQPKQLWSVTWDTVVSIISDDKETASAPHKVGLSSIFLHVTQLTTLHTTHGQPQIEMLAQRSIKDAYSSVGGLNKQIEEIRDLLEIPLTRPELFRYFGGESILQYIYNLFV